MIWLTILKGTCPLVHYRHQHRPCRVVTFLLDVPQHGLQTDDPCIKFIRCAVNASHGSKPHNFVYRSQSVDARLASLALQINR